MVGHFDRPLCQQGKELMASTKLRTFATATAIAACSIAFVGCTTTPPDARSSTAGTAATRTSIDAQVNDALTKLYDTVPGSRELVAKSSGVLVFPAVVGASFVVGAEYGRGALLVKGSPQSYYSTTAGSIGWQAGAQSKAMIYVFTTQTALDKFRNSNGWTVGADATVAIANIGANGSIDTNTARQPIVGFVLTNVGLEAGVSLQGAKITKIQL
jgi:lipid-binding SYLF domain-containing protein